MNSFDNDSNILDDILWTFAYLQAGLFITLCVGLICYRKYCSYENYKATTIQNGHNKNLDTFIKWHQYGEEMNEAKQHWMYVAAAYEQALSYEHSPKNSAIVKEKLAELFMKAASSATILNRSKYRKKALDYYLSQPAQRTPTAEKNILNLHHLEYSSEDWLHFIKNEAGGKEIIYGCEIYISQNDASPKAFYKAAKAIDYAMNKRTKTYLTPKHREFKDYFYCLKTKHGSFDLMNKLFNELLNYKTMFLTMASEGGHILALQELISEISKNQYDSKELYTKGTEALAQAKQGHPCFRYAMALFKMARPLPEAHYVLGVMLANGMGCDISFVQAQKEFEDAAKHGYEPAKVALVFHTNSTLTTASQWLQRGKQYNKEEKYLQAKTCFIKANSLAPALAEPYYQLAKHLRDRDRDLPQAKKFLLLAKYNANPKLSKKINEQIVFITNLSRGIRIGIGAFGALETVSSFFVSGIIPYVGPFLSHGVRAQGLNLLQQSISSPDEQLLNMNTLSSACSAGFTGLVTGVALQTASNLITPYVNDVRLLPFISETTEANVKYIALSGSLSVLSCIASNMVEDVFYQRAILSAFSRHDLLVSFISGCVGRSFNLVAFPLLNGFYKDVFDSIIERNAKQLAMMALGSMGGMIYHGSSNVLVRLVSNTYYKYIGNREMTWHHGFREAILAGMIHGSILGSFEGLHKFEELERIKKFNEALKALKENALNFEKISSAALEDLKNKAEAYLNAKATSEATILKYLERAVKEGYVFDSYGFKHGKVIHAEDLPAVLDLIHQGQVVSLKFKHKSDSHYNHLVLSKNKTQIPMKFVDKTKRTFCYLHPTGAKSLDQLEQEVIKASQNYKDLLNKNGFDGDAVLARFESERKRLLDELRKCPEYATSRQNGVLTSFRTDLLMRDDYEPDFRDPRNVWDCIETAALCSKSSYLNKDKFHQGPNGLVNIGYIQSFEYGFDLFCYADPEKNTIYFSVKGSQKASQWLQQDVALALTGQLFAITQEVENCILQFQQTYPAANIIFTGHSLGAAIASLLAMHFKKPALVFDNPGHRHSGDESYVTSFLTIKHAENTWLGHEGKGNVIPLILPKSNFSLGFFKNIYQPLVPEVIQGLVNLYGHKMNYIIEAIQRTKTWFSVDNKHINQNAIDLNASIMYNNCFSYVLKCQYANVISISQSVTHPTVIHSTQQFL